MQENAQHRVLLSFVHRELIGLRNTDTAEDARTGVIVAAGDTNLSPSALSKVARSPSPSVYSFVSHIEELKVAWSHVENCSRSTELSTREGGCDSKQSSAAVKEAKNLCHQRTLPRTGSSTIISMHANEQEHAFVREEEFHPLPSAVKHLSAHPNLVRRLVDEFENSDNLLDAEELQYFYVRSSVGAGGQDDTIGAEVEDNVIGIVSGMNDSAVQTIRANIIGNANEIEEVSEWCILIRFNNGSPS